jgi:GDP-L-fucose synthase
VIRGSGKPLRQFIYSEDLANMIMRVVEKGEEPNMILSVPDEYSIKQVGHLIAASFDYEDRIVFAPSFADGQYKKTVSSDKWIAFSKEDPITHTSIQKGIAETVKWFITNYAESRI